MTKNVEVLIWDYNKNQYVPVKLRPSIQVKDARLVREGGHLFIKEVHRDK
jgi:hypothetical protein